MTKHPIIDDLVPGDLFKWVYKVVGGGARDSIQYDPLTSEKAWALYEKRFILVGGIHVVVGVTNDRLRFSWMNLNGEVHETAFDEFGVRTANFGRVYLPVRLG